MVLTLTHGINFDSRPWPKEKQGSAKAKKAFAQHQSPPQELDVSNGSGLYLLVLNIYITSTHFTLFNGELVITYYHISYT